MKRVILAVVALVLSVNTVFAADIYGSWTTPDRKSIIKISKCGGSICGKITKTAETGMKDIHNPDAAKQSRPLKGLQIFKFKDKAGTRKWEGKLYNTRDGKTYSGHVIMLDGDNKIKLEGCVLIFCQGETWSRI